VTNYSAAKNTIYTINISIYKSSRRTEGAKASQAERVGHRGSSGSDPDFLAGSEGTDHPVLSGKLCRLV